jgi:hypothetical protein
MNLPSYTSAMKNLIYTNLFSNKPGEVTQSPHCFASSVALKRFSGTTYGSERCEFKVDAECCTMERFKALHSGRYGGCLKAKWGERS